MVNGFQPLLHIGPDTQLKGRTNQNAYVPRIEFTKQLQFAAFCMVVMDKCDLRSRNAALYGKGTDLPCAAGGVVLGIEMWLFLSKERNRV